MKKKYFLLLILNLILFSIMFFYKKETSNIINVTKKILSEKCYSLTSEAFTDQKINLYHGEVLGKKIMINNVSKDQLINFVKNNNKFKQTKQGLISYNDSNIFLDIEKKYIKPVSCKSIFSYFKKINNYNNKCYSKKDSSDEVFYYKIINEDLIGFEVKGIYSSFKQDYFDKMLKNKQKSYTINYPYNFSKNVIDESIEIKCPEDYTVKFFRGDCITGGYSILDVNEEYGYYIVSGRRSPAAKKEEYKFLYFKDQNKYNLQECVQKK